MPTASLLSILVFSTLSSLALAIPPMCVTPTGNRDTGCRLGPITLIEASRTDDGSGFSWAAVETKMRVNESIAGPGQFDVTMRSTTSSPRGGGYFKSKQSERSFKIDFVQSTEPEVNAIIIAGRVDVEDWKYNFGRPQCATAEMFQIIGQKPGLGNCIPFCPKDFGSAKCGTGLSFCWDFAQTNDPQHYGSGVWSMIVSDEDQAIIAADVNSRKSPIAAVIGGVGTEACADSPLGSSIFFTFNTHLQINPVTNQMELLISDDAQYCRSVVDCDKSKKEYKVATFPIFK